MRQKESRKVHPFRKLSDVEENEEIIYKRQLKESWSFRPGMHPIDVWEREHAKEND